MNYQILTHTGYSVGKNNAKEVTDFRCLGGTRSVGIQLRSYIAEEPAEQPSEQPAEKENEQLAARTPREPGTPREPLKADSKSC